MSGIEIIPVKNLYQVIGYLQNLIKIEALEPAEFTRQYCSPFSIGLMRIPAIVQTRGTICPGIRSRTTSESLPEPFGSKLEFIQESLQ